MIRWFLSALALLATIMTAAPAGEITGQYVEARTCDVYTGPCFANADTGLTGKHAVMAWKVEKGKLDNVSLDGLSIVEADVVQLALLDFPGHDCVLACQAGVSIGEAGPGVHVAGAGLNV